MTSFQTYIFCIKYLSDFFYFSSDMFSNIFPVLFPICLQLVFKKITNSKKSSFQNGLIQRQNYPLTHLLHLIFCYHHHNDVLQIKMMMMMVLTARQLPLNRTDCPSAETLHRNLTAISTNTTTIIIIVIIVNIVTIDIIVMVIGRHYLQHRR